MIERVFVARGFDSRRRVLELHMVYYRRQWVNIDNGVHHIVDKSYNISKYVITFGFI
jgi:hypothetical protein